MPGSLADFMLADAITISSRPPPATNIMKIKGPRKSTENSSTKTSFQEALYEDLAV